MYSLILRGQPQGTQRKSYLSSPTHSKNPRPFLQENQSCSATTRGTTQAEITCLPPTTDSEESSTLTGHLLPRQRG